MQEKLLLCLRIVFRRIAAYMPDHYFYFFAHKNELLRVRAPDIIAVNIAIHPSYYGVRVILLQLIGQRYISEIACMPYFIAP